MIDAALFLALACILLDRLTVFVRELRRETRVYVETSHAVSPSRSRKA
jgi:hypothetical protein